MSQGKLACEQWVVSSVSSEQEHVSGEECYPPFLVSLAIDSTLVSYIKKGVNL